METILVTGDVVLDCHLYGGSAPGASASGGTGTSYSEQLGGAALTHGLLKAAASGYETHLGIDIAGLKRRLPKHLRSYGVWVEKPAEKGRVWRAQSAFGYGSVDPPRQAVFERDPAQSVTSPLLTLIDDGGILFRHGVSHDVWPDFSKKGTGHFILKTTSPLCRGDLWAALEPVMDRLTVVVSAADLRREDAQIDSHLSWEQCVEHTIRALETDPVVRGLTRAADVVVSFGSAGALHARRGRDGKPATYHLVCDPKRLEGDHSRTVAGTVYGFQTCLVAGIAHHLIRSGDEAGREKRGALPGGDAFDAALHDGIAAGLSAKRALLDLGHGLVDSPKPGFPFDALGRIVATSAGGFVRVAVPAGVDRPHAPRWTILSQTETSTATASEAATPLTGLAHLAGRYGLGALSHVPSMREGPLFTVDRSEIESFRTLGGLIRAYDRTKVQKRPLSIGVFGPPGAGKSFGVEALAKGILGRSVPFLEFNLSQFKSPDELIGAFHRVRDAVLRGITPVAFWDEFDSQNYRWLQYLLAPMQDGSFQEGQITHPIGKCIFVFAGGTTATLEGFGVASPESVAEEDLAGLDDAERRGRLHEQSERYREFKLLKGPDFISRLHGFLDVLGPNPRQDPAYADVTWPIRRALILRGILRLADDQELDIDDGLLDALLGVSAYAHGARSFEKIVRALLQDSEDGRLRRSALPPQPLLGRETDAAGFQQILRRRDEFKDYPDIEDLAAAVHFNFLQSAKRSESEAQAKKDRGVAWAIDPSIKQAYADLTADAKAASRAAARRVPDHLALIGFTVQAQQPGDRGTWKAFLTEAIGTHIDRLAQAEHIAWCAERIANGWTYAKDRDNKAKHHHLLVDWAELSPADQEKDRAFVRTIPQLLEIAGFKAVPVEAPR